jgi:hypothetical protein
MIAALLAVLTLPAHVKGVYIKARDGNRFGNDR